MLRRASFRAQEKAQHIGFSLLYHSDRVHIGVAGKIGELQAGILGHFLQHIRHKAVMVIVNIHAIQGVPIIRDRNGNGAFLRDVR